MRLTELGWRAIVVVLGLCLLGAEARAQCGRWLRGGIPGADSDVNAMITWDPDGAGPARPVLVVGGTFGQVDDVYPAHTVTWDGVRWAAMDPDPESNVHAWAVWNGSLYASGSWRIGSSITQAVRRWNGTGWDAPLGTADGTINTIAVINGQMVAGGAFSVMGGYNASRIAYFNGSRWVALGSGMNDQVFTLAQYNGRIVAGGRFTTAGGAPIKRVATWSGTAWLPLGAGFDDANVYGLIVHNGSLIAGGGFVYSNGVAVNRIARWNGQLWEPMGNGFTNGVLCLGTYRGELIAAGALGLTADPYGVARWTGTAWAYLPAVDGLVYTQCEYDGRLWVGGTMYSAGSAGGRGIMQWDGQRWAGVGLGVDELVRDMAVLGDRVYAVGDFEVADGDIAKNVAAWDGAHWHGLASALGGPPQDPEVACVAAFNGKIIVGGAFGSINGVAATNIAAWDGSAWAPLGPGLNASVFALKVFRGELYAAGRFSAAGSVTAVRLAHWDGVRWAGVPAVNGQSTAQFYHMEVFQDRLYVAGGFQLQLPGQSPATAQNIVSWDGAQLRPLGSGLYGNAGSLAVYGSRLVVVGPFTLAGGLPFPHSAAWDGSAWSDFGSRNDLAFGVLSAGQSGLVVSLIVTSPSAGQVSGLARWNGSAWVVDPPEFTVVAGQDLLVLCFADLAGEWLLGGLLVCEAQGVPTRYFARWSPTGVPTFVRQPASGSLPCGAEWIIPTELTPGYEPLTTRWQWSSGVGGAWQDLEDGVLVVNSQDVATVSGADSTTLRVLPTVGAFAVRVRCVVANVCGEAQSAEALLAADCPVPCDLDVNQDGNADQDDVAYLVNVIAGAPNPTGVDPDLNHDGNADQGDIASLIEAVAGGPCP